MRDFLYVFIGGGVGSMMRYLVGKCLSTSASGFPWGTFTVNVVGCFLIGLLTAWIARQSLSADIRLLLVVGFCGGFTTFSTFSNEALALMRSGETVLFALYLAGCIVAGLLAVWAGSFLVRG